MRPYTKVFLSIGALLLLIIVGVWGITIRNLTVIADKPGPLYQGRTLSEWLFIYSENVDASNTTAAAEAEEARKAIRNVGTNALPVVLEWLAEQPTEGRYALIEHFPRYLISDAQRQSALKNAEEQERRAGRAVYFFRIWGAEVSVATPALAEILNSHPESHRRATYALGLIGTNSLPAMANFLANTNSALRPSVLNSIIYAQRLGADWSSAVPLLLRHVDDNEFQVSSRCMKALATIGREPEICIHLFTNKLKSSDLYERRATVDALGKFGPNAAAAIPALIPLLNDSEEDVRGHTTNALHKIAPDIYTNVWRPTGLQAIPMSGLTNR